MFLVLSIDIRKKKMSSYNFINSVTKLFSFLKNMESYSDSCSVSIKFDGGFLLPITYKMVEDSSLIEDLCNWRIAASYAFNDEKPPTLEGTKLWLQKYVLDVNNKVLFLVVNDSGCRIGHMGWANCSDLRSMEIDNVVRGITNSEKGIMSKALLAMIRWAKESLFPETIFLRVIPTNNHAIDFYKKLSFNEDSHQPEDRYLRMVYNEKETIPSTPILTAGPSITPFEQYYTQKAVYGGWNSKWAEYLDRFEQAFSEFSGLGYCIPTSSCTGALQIALSVLFPNPKKEWEIIVPATTWVATASVVEHAGMTPVFADIDAETWCLNPACLEALITKNTRGIIPVHLYGHPADVPVIRDLANSYNLVIIEDAAAAIGAKYNGYPVGSLSDIACFSFQGAKLVVTGEGGMFCTNDRNIYNRAKVLADQGRKISSNPFDISQIGWKFKMSNMQAAFGLGQLEHVEDMLYAKRRLHSWYNSSLREYSNKITLNQEKEGFVSSFWMCSVTIKDFTKSKTEELRKLLKTKYLVDTRPVFQPICDYPMWNTKESVPVSRYIGNTSLNLPSGVCISKEQANYIAKSLISAISELC